VGGYRPVTAWEELSNDGVSTREIILCRKRYIARQAYQAIVADLGQQVSAERRQPNST